MLENPAQNGDLQLMVNIFTFIKEAGINYLLASVAAAVAVFAAAVFKVSRPLKKIQVLAEGIFTRDKNEVSTPQAIELYSQLMHRLRGDLERVFYRTLEHNRRRLKILEIDIRNDFEEEIRRIFEGDLNSLSLFNVNGRRLADYHLNTWQEMNTLKNYLLAALFNEELRPAVNSHIRLKTDGILTSAKLWITRDNKQIEKIKEIKEYSDQAKPEPKPPAPRVVKEGLEAEAPKIKPAIVENQ